MSTKNCVIREISAFQRGNGNNKPMWNSHIYSILTQWCLICAIRQNNKNFPMCEKLHVPCNYCSWHCPQNHKSSVKISTYWHLVFLSEPLLWRNFTQFIKWCPLISKIKTKIKIRVRWLLISISDSKSKLDLQFTLF